ncbi:MAG TPA: 2-C-methyl-D-erythritol 4-phosphate cytidylyltransferase [Microbacteriaceae bacterium]|nr:2-C-methyl-D-erythritol 4-phosphate cytidylyltransferase [Microbacteriaceae bacterium]
MSEIAVIVVAAGSGSRLGHPEPKAFVALRGRTVLEHALDGIAGMRTPATVIVVAPAPQLDAARQAAPNAIVVAGGATRQESVAAGIAALPEPARIVLVHDAARALTPAALFDRVVDAVRAHGIGVVPGLPVADTLKRVDADGMVDAAVDRADLVAVQTPQGFPREVLEGAHAAAAEVLTDDAALVSALGQPVRTIAGEPLAFKITTPADLRRATESLGGATRTGVGVDAHAFAPGVPLRLGGVLWPDAPEGLSGHSDGDAACHAIVDALLSAAGLGDIGSRFGTDDPAYAGASGATFIAEAVRLLAVEGWVVLSASVEIIANGPKIGPRRADLESVLSGLVGAPVSVAATTSDGLGLTGEGRGIAAIATALITPA